MYLILGILGDKQLHAGLEDTTGPPPLCVTEPEFSFPLQTPFPLKSAWIWRAFMHFSCVKQEKPGEGAKSFTIKWGSYKISQWGQTSTFL